MLYKVLYRKWRPKTFDEVVGQEHITETLKNEIETGKIAHAYLFTGIRGTGKTTCAKILAKAINCLRPVNGNPCGVCEACKSIEKEKTMDVIEIDAAGNNGVENIRNIIDETSFTPANLKKRVYIIDEVHMLSIGAFNAFLKTLEEPSEHVVFILATTEINKIPATILSRCQRFDFYRIPLKEMTERLTYIAKKENVKLEDEAATLISKLSNGSLRDALSVFDRCIMNASEKNEKNDYIEVTYSTVVDAVGIVGRASLLELADFIIDGNKGKIINQINEFYNFSKDMSSLLRELIEHFRDIMIFKTVKDVKSITELSNEDLNVVSQQAGKIQLKKVLNIIDLLEKADSMIKKSTDSRIDIEVSLVRLCDIPAKDENQNNDLLRKIQNLEKEIDLLKSKNINIRTESNSIIKTDDEIDSNSHRVPLNFDMEQAINKAVPMKEWEKVLKILENKSHSMSSAFASSKAYVSDGYLFIDSKNEFAFTLLRESSKRNEIRYIIEEVTGKKYKLGPYKKNRKQEEQGLDPLDSLKNKVSDLGIPININDEQYK